MLVGVIIALQLAWWPANLGLPWTTFGRLRPLHTNAVIFAFAGNICFTGIYYSMQRLLKTRMWSDALSSIHFWGWQLIIVSAAITYPLGLSQSREYAELIWPIDVAVTLIWVVFAVNFFGTLAIRKVKHIYVAIWFYMSFVITIAVLHIVNNLAVPATLLRSYPIYSGLTDALVQWWYGHNAVGFFLTTPFLGLMYYFLPKAAERPVYSYKLSILHFWSLVFIYIWAGPHHLHYTALPEWASTLGMAFSVMLWMPSWGGMINGLLTLRGAWHKVVEDPVLKFFVVAITAYGMSTFEGPMLSIKSVNALAHYSDWIIAHVHTGTLGWNGFMTFGMIYWLLPRLFQTKLYSKKLAEWHFWIGSFGILLYVVAIYSAGITEGLMWRAFDATGRLAYPDWIETVVRVLPMWWMRAVGGTLYIVGMLMFGWNILMTWRNRPAVYNVPVIQAPPLARAYVPEPVTEPQGAWARFVGLGWHRMWEGRWLLFTVMVIIAVAVASLFEILPTFLIRDNVPTISSVKPYTPLELAGRDLYIREGCYLCHSQMIRPFRWETERFGEYSKPGEFVYDHPFQWGSRRIGPDLAREGGKYPDLWHVRHMQDPRSITPRSIMPGYAFLLTDDLDFASIQKKVDVMAMLGVPYGSAVIEGNAPTMAHAQAQLLADTIAQQGGPKNLQTKEIVALIAYIQRLGWDATHVAAPTAAPAATTGGGNTP